MFVSGLRPSRAALALIALFAVGLALRAYAALALHFDGLYGQDAYAYYDFGGQTLTAFAHFQLPGHFNWPLGYPVLVALGLLFTPGQALGPQILTMICGALVGVFTYLLAVEVTQQFYPSIPQPLSPTQARGKGRSTRLIDSLQPGNLSPGLIPRLTGVIAWLIVTVCGQLTQSSIVIMSDAPALMWATGSAWALLRYGRTRKPIWIALSAFALAWAAMTRWQYAGLALPWALYVFLNRPFRWKHAAIAFAVGMITLTPQIIHTVQNPDPLLKHMWIQGWSPENALVRDFTTADGTFHYDQPPASYYAQPLYSLYYSCPLFIPFIVLGLLIILFRRKILLIPLIGWIAVQYGFLAAIPYENIRFALAIFPPLALLTGIGAASLILIKPVRWRLILAPLTIAIVIYGSLNVLHTSVPLVVNFVENKERDLAAAKWIEAQIPESNAKVYCLDLLLTMQHYTSLQPVQIYQMTPEALQAQLSSPSYAVFNLWTTEHQWYGQSPWIIYHWLLDHPGMTEIGSFGNYTLFRINS